MRTVALSLLLVASLAANAYLYLQAPTPVTAPLTQKQQDQQGRVAELEAQLAQAMGEIKKIKAERVATAAAGAASPQPALGAPAGQKTVDPKKQMQQAVAQMMADPAMREMTIQQQTAQLENQYAGLFASLQLSDEEKLHFKQLLSARTRAKIESALKLVDPALPVEQQKAIAAEMKAKEKESNELIKQFMNDSEDYNAFTRWEDSLGERQMLQLGKPVFENARVPLSSDQENQLVELMAAVHRQKKALPNVWKPEEMVGQQVNDPFIQRQMQQYDLDAQNILGGAGSFLTPQQLEALRTMLDQQRNLMQAGMKMSASMTK